MNTVDGYPYIIRPLKLDEGNGFLIEFPDFWGCISDGSTPEQALTNGRDALQATIEALQHFGHPVPAPFSHAPADACEQKDEHCNHDPYGPR